MSEKDNLAQTLERENATTLRVLKALPADQIDFKPPHDKFRSARELGIVFVGEMTAMMDIMDGHIDFSKEGLWPSVNNWDDVIKGFEQQSATMIAKLKACSESDLNQMMEFAGIQMRRLDALYGMMFDIVHHRGQFSVYVRLAGGKVPSIYGPSGDEPMDA